MYLIQIRQCQSLQCVLSLNPYSNGTMYLIRCYQVCKHEQKKSLNPYSNGTMYLMRKGNGS